MIRRNINFTEESFNFLKALQTLKLNAHVQRAVDEYIERLKSLNVSASQSKRKEDENG